MWGPRHTCLPCSSSWAGVLGDTSVFLLGLSLRLAALRCPAGVDPVHQSAPTAHGQSLLPLLPCCASPEQSAALTPCVSWQERPRPRVPILHFRAARPPFVICVKLVSVRAPWALLHLDTIVRQGGPHLGSTGWVCLATVIHSFALG